MRIGAILALPVLALLVYVSCNEDWDVTHESDEQIEATTPGSTDSTTTPTTTVKPATVDDLQTMMYNLKWHVSDQIESVKKGPTTRSSPAAYGCDLRSGRCWSKCVGVLGALGLSQSDWCYTTRTYSQSYAYVHCSGDTDCNKDWKCAGPCTTSQRFWGLPA